MLKKPSYVIYGAHGVVDTLFCKICGDKIAGTVLRVKGSGPDINVRVPRFTRFSNYAEIKFTINDGSYHVTNGCRNCLGSGLTPATLQELYLADMDDMGLLPLGRVAEELVTVDYSAQGII